MKRVLAMALAGALALSMLTACGGGNGDGSSTGAGSFPGTPDEDCITLNLGGEPAQLFSTLNTESVSGYILGHTMEGLMGRDQNGDLSCTGAESYTYDEETMTYTFKLRENAVWSNGEPVTAHDYVFAYRALVDPAFAADYAYFGYVFKNGQAVNEGKVAPEELGVKAVDDYTFEVTMETPCPYVENVFAMFTLYPVNEKAYNEYGDLYGTDADKILTNGPYDLKEWSHENQIVLEKSETYWNKDTITLPKMVWKMMSDKNTAMNEFQAGNLDYMTDLTGDQVVALKEAGANVGTYNSNGIKYVQYNVTKPGLNNIKIRRAFMMSIDNQSLCDNVLKDSSQPLYAMVPDTIDNGRFAEVAGAPLFAYDPEEAKKLLEEGLAEENMTVADLNKYTIICDDDDVSQKLVAFVLEQWKTNLGVEIQPQVVPRKSRVVALSTHEFDLIISGWYPDYDDPNTFLDMFITGGGNNSGEWSNAEYDALIAKAAAEMDHDTRAQYFADAQKILIDEAAIAPMYGMYRNYVTSDKMTGEIVNANQTTFRWVQIQK